MRYILTLHAMQRSEQRGISVEEIIESIKYPDKINKRYDKYYVQKDLVKGIVEVVYERRENYIKVITVYWLS